MVYFPFTSPMQFVVSNRPVRFCAVPGLSRPCITSAFLADDQIQTVAASCELCVTFASNFTGATTELLGFCVVSEAFADVLIPLQWFEHRFPLPGVFDIVLEVNKFDAASAYVTHITRQPGPNQDLAALNSYLSGVPLCPPVPGVVVRNSTTSVPFQEGCSSSPMIVSQAAQLIIANKTVRYVAVRNLVGPCLSSAFLEEHRLSGPGVTCSFSVTYPTFAGCQSEVMSFAIVENCPVDLLIPVEWFIHRSLEPDIDDSDMIYRCITEKTPTLNVHVQSVLKDIIIPETVIHDTVPSHEGVQAGCSSNPMPSLPNIHGYQYLKSLFYGERFAGSTNHVFSSNETDIYDLLQAHGMSIHCDLSLRENRAKLLQHVIHGDCMRDPEDDAHQHDITSPYGCSLAFRNHVSCEELQESCLRILAQSNARQISCDDLITVAESIGLIGPFHSPKNLRHRLLIGIARHIKQTFVSRALLQRHFDPLNDLFFAFDRLQKGPLLAVLERHAIPIPLVPAERSRSKLKKLVMKHMGEGGCMRNRTRLACDEIADSLTADAYLVDDNILAQKIHLFKSLKYVLSKKSLLVMLDVHNIDHDVCGSYVSLKRSLQNHINSLKTQLIAENRVNALDELERQKRHGLDNWPTPVPTSLKDRLVNLFNEETSVTALATLPCASCSQKIRVHDLHNVDAGEFDWRPLVRPNKAADAETAEQDALWLEGISTNLRIPCHPALPEDVIVDPEGLHVGENGVDYVVQLCGACYNSLCRHQLPALALANHLVLGDVPPELQGLNSIEESMIARCRAKSWIIQLNTEEKEKRNEDREAVSMQTTQRGLKGHVIIHPQDPTPLLDLLPPPVEEICTPICVILIGSKQPSKEWLREQATPLVVRREKVRIALCWLIAHNPHYRNVRLDSAALDAYPENDIVPVHIEMMNPVRDVEDSLTGSYDPTVSADNALPPADGNKRNEIAYQNVVISGVDASASSSKLRAAAFRHVSASVRGCFVQVSHAPQTANEFFNPSLFPMLYPTLFPYGLGGFEDPNRSSALSLKRQVAHFFSLADNRFRSHQSFLFIVFSVLQKRAILLHTGLRVKSTGFDNFSEVLASISDETIRVVCDRVTRGDAITCNSSDESKILTLLNEVNVVTAKVPCSSASRVAMRNEIRGLIMEKGLPTFYLTLNPADVYNPVLKFLAGSDIDLDNLLPADVPKWDEQAVLVAKNPAVASQFFNLYMTKFCEILLGYSSRPDLKEGGVLGHVSAYYGCVEAQGRGSLHCHMLVWIDGALNCDEIRVKASVDSEFAARLITYLDDALSTAVPDTYSDVSVPSDGVQPCSVRGPLAQNYAEEMYRHAVQKDLHSLVEACQKHKHTGTCWKYCKDKNSKQVCRFGLSEDNVLDHSYFDPESGDLLLRHLQGLINTFNSTIIRALRCNMDIKYLGSGPSTKAIIYYITDYITKSQLKTHVAYAALQVAINGLQSVEFESDDIAGRAKRLLQKCAFSMVSRQELSSQQVVSYLRDYDDHFTSHSFQKMFWLPMEKYMHSVDPLASTVPTMANLKDGNDECSEINVPTEADHLQSNELGQHEQLDEDEDVDDVGIVVTDTGTVMKKPSQLQGYLSRGPLLKSFSLWEYTSLVDKIKVRGNNTSGLKSSEDSHVIVRSEDLFNDNHNRFKAQFAGDYSEFSTHFQQVKRVCNKDVVVLIGPALPRRDRVQYHERYCRLMLLFFKPWQTATDLLAGSSSWSEALERFCDINPEISKRLDNMQSLHECKDSRDDHFAFRVAERRNTAINQDENFNTADASEDNPNEGCSDVDLAAFVSSVCHKQSDKKIASQKDSLLCLKNAAIGNVTGSNYESHAELDDRMSLTETVSHGDYQEKIWAHQYTERKQLWKKSIRLYDPILKSTNLAVPQTVLRPSINSVADASNAIPLNPSIAPNFQADDCSAPENMGDKVCQEFKLNEEQQRAFNLVAEHSTNNAYSANQLRMFLAGHSGTGKSRIINALRSFFCQKRESRRFRVAAYTGVAAHNILGTTLHAALMLDTRLSQKSRKELIEMWQGVDYLVIDEVSMIGCSFLTRLHRALCLAKESEELFGGINIIFAGDFAQLPPVCDTRLYTHLTRTAGATKQAEAKIQGKLLWLSINKVVILKKVMRQCDSPTSAVFISLLDRLRHGCCTSEDYALLSSAVVSRSPIDARQPVWINSPVIVSDNATKDALNEQMAHEYAIKAGRTLHHYYARDRRGGQNLKDHKLIQDLRNCDSADTGHRQGSLPLVLGMPVVLLQNFDVAGGVVNGSHGILIGVKYFVNGVGEREASSCTVNLSDACSESMHELQPMEMPVIADSIPIQLTEEYSGKKMTFRRTQLPVAPGFVITAHKSQSLSFPSATVDLQSCCGTEKPYVMISRITALENLRILRPFDFKKIKSRPSEDIRKENIRCSLLAEETLATGLEPHPNSIALDPDSFRLSAKCRLEKVINAQKDMEHLVDAHTRSHFLTNKRPLEPCAENSLRLTKKRK